MIVFPFQLICNPESKLIPKESQTDWAKSLSSWPLTHFLQQWRKKQQSNLHHKVKVCICSEHTWRGRYTSKTRLPHLPPIPPPLPPVIQLIPYGHSRNKCHTITHTHKYKYQPSMHCTTVYIFESSHLGTQKKWMEPGGPRLHISPKQWRLHKW